MRLVDLSGQVFGRLTVIKYLGDRQWLCKCSCGNETIVYASNLVRGHTKSCGCLRGTGIVGKNYGTLTVLKAIDVDTYLCQCSCGQQCKRKYASLVQSHETATCDKCVETSRIDALRSAAFVDGTQPSRLMAKPSKANKSGVVGVNWDKSRGKWMAGIKFKGHRYNLGRYNHIQDAIDARKAAEKEIFGDFLKWYENFIKPKKG